MEPLQLGILAALTPSDVEVVLYDDRMEPIPYDEPTDLAITVETFTQDALMKSAMNFVKRRAVKGGMHAMLIPDEVSEHCDAVIVGDAEPVWRK